MFEIAEQFLVQLVGLMPAVFGIYVLFDLIGSLLFGKRQFMGIILFFILFCFLSLMVVVEIHNQSQSLKDRIYILECLVEILRDGDDIDI